MMPPWNDVRAMWRIAAAVCVSGAAVALAGCASASASPGWDATAGEAVQMLRAQQTLDLAASRTHANKLTLQDGRNTREALERHADSYRNPPQPSTVINLGR